MANKQLDKILEKAKEVVTNNDRFKGLLGEVKDKMDKINQDSEERSSFLYQIQMIIRMLRSHYNGSYRAFSTSTIFSLVFALVYFITPVDLIPDFIPALGFADDISLVYMVIRSVSNDISRYQEWEEES